MSFNDIKKIENYQFYLDKAISRAQNKASLARTKKSKDNQLTKSKTIELLKINIISDILRQELKKIVEDFPMVDNLDDFYRELVKISLDHGLLKKSLGSLNWANKKVTEFNTLYSGKITKARQITSINSYRREFYGRVSSLMKQMKTYLANIEESRKVMRHFPSIKTSMKTIAIAGFPNVGKTTILAKITHAKAEIANYAFTTKRINLGYYEDDKQKIQFIDTPGTLNRFNKMNIHERQAYLALKYLAEKIIYVFDLTESSYPLSDQEKLYDEMNKLNKPMFVFLSKTDLIKNIPKEFSKKYKCIKLEDAHKI